MNASAKGAIHPCRADVDQERLDQPVQCDEEVRGAEHPARRCRGADPRGQRQERPSPPPAPGGRDPAPKRARARARRTPPPKAATARIDQALRRSFSRANRARCLHTRSHGAHFAPNPAGPPAEFCRCLTRRGGTWLATAPRPEAIERHRATPRADPDSDECPVLPPRRIRSRLIRRGSASTTSKSGPAGWWITSPRAGTRPASMKTRPPTVSTSSSSSPSTSRRPITASNSSSGAREATSQTPSPSCVQ